MASVRSLIGPVNGPRTASWLSDVAMAGRLLVTVVLLYEVKTLRSPVAVWQSSPKIKLVLAVAGQGWVVRAPIDLNRSCEFSNEH